MTKPRGIISASLAERGRPEMWANEQEAAALSGMSPQHFSGQIERLEALGFPKPTEWNDKRFIPHIIDFWREQASRPILQPPDLHEIEQSKETWDRDRPRSRKRIPA